MGDFFGQVADIKRTMENVKANIAELEDKQSKALTDVYGGGDFKQSWPTNERPLTRTQVKEMQSLLTRRGFSTGGIDGQVGPMTREAIRGFQTASGKVPDGYASTQLLQDLQRR